jgi:WD40 repeat protein
MVASFCPRCGKKLQVPDDLAGKRVKCPLCREVFPFPARPAPQDELTPTSPGPMVAGLASAPPDELSLCEAETEHGIDPGAASSSGSSAKPGPETWDFLAPPLRPDELGRLGPYRVLRVLGAGGMGVVFLAEDPQLERPVALKAMRPALAASASARQRFLREARAVAAIEHDHIVSVYQVGEDRGVPFLAMQLLRGETLDDRLRREKILPMAQVLRIGREVATGLAAAHRRGLVHRDVKPANVWLEAETGRVKIVDFGLARAAGEDSQLTQEGSVVGTPSYMAPEQGAGKPVGPASDLFSLGVLLYRLCTGELPFQGANALATLMAVAIERQRPAREINPEVSAALSELVERLLAKEPDERPASAQAAAEALRAIEYDQTAELPRPQAAAPRRRRAWLAAGVACALGAVLGPAAFVYFASRDDERTEDRHPAEKAPPMAPVKPGPGRGQPARPRPSVPVSPLALVSRPGHRRGVESWSVETRGHLGVVLQAAYSPDSRRLASGGADGSVRQWDAATGTLQAVLLGHTGPVLSLAWSPDGHTVASGSADHTIRLWDAGSGTDRLLRGHRDAVLALAWSPDGKTLASAGNEGVVRLWEGASGNWFRTIDLRPARAVLLLWRGGGKTLVGVGRPKDRRREVWVWEAGTGRAVFHRDVPLPFTFLDHARVLIHPGEGKELVFRELDGDKVRRTMTLTERPDLLAAARDGKVLASSTRRSFFLWEAGSGRLLSHRRTAGRSICRISFAPDGRRVLTCGVFAHGVQVWDAATGKPGRPLKARGRVWSAGWSPDGKFVLSLSSRQETAECWEAASGRKLFDLPVYRAAAQAAAWSPDGKLLAASNRFGDQPTVRLWDLTAGRLRHLLPVTMSPRTEFIPVAWSPAGPTLATSAADGRVQLWDANTGAPLKLLEAKHAGWVSALAWSPDGKMLASFAEEGWLWGTAAGQPLRALTGRPPGRVTVIAWSPDGTSLATADPHRAAVDLWDAATGKHRRTLSGHAAGVTALAWSPGGGLLASGSLDKTVRLWKAAGDLEETLKDPPGGPAKVFALAWLPDGQGLAALCGNRTVPFWRVGAGPATPGGHRPALRGRAVFSPNGLRLAGVFDPTGIRLWDTKTGQPRGVLVFLRAGKPDEYLGVTRAGRILGVPGLVGREVVYVVKTAEGQRTLTPAEFAAKYGRN